MKYKIIFSYDGSLFFGFAKQPGLKTIQGELEKNLSLILNEEIIISASGRTDKGVHALNQVASFEISDEIKEKSKFLHSLNKLLNGEIFVKNLAKVHYFFDARYSAKKKRYFYLINFGVYNPLEKNYVNYISDKNFDYKKMIEASSIFLGTHNFQNYCSKKEDQDGFIRTIYSIKFIKKGKKLKIVIEGNGFMRYQIRKIVGSLIYLATDKTNLETLKNYLEKKERDIIPFTAESSALYLDHVFY